MQVLFAWLLVFMTTIDAKGNGATTVPFARAPTKFDMKSKTSVRSDKRKESSTSGKGIGILHVDVASVKDTFFTKVEEHNKEASNMLNQLFHTKSGWEYVNTKDGVKVEKRTLPAGTFVDASDAEKGSKHACVKSTGIVKASSDAVFDLFMDNARVSEYNEHCKEMKDIHAFPKGMNPTENTWTKISWASSPKYGPFKARDFVSVVNFRRFKNGTAVILNRPAYHPSYKPGNKFVRATILLAGNMLEPCGPGNEHCKITQIAHVNPGGGADTAAMAWVINKLCAVGPPTFIRRLESAAMRSERAAGACRSKKVAPWEQLKVPKWWGDALSKRKAVIVAWEKSTDKWRKR